jgi:hypothetical protein
LYAVFAFLTAVASGIDAAKTVDKLITHATGAGQYAGFAVFFFLMSTFSAIQAGKE